MPNNFNMNSNKKVFLDEFSATTINGNFSNNAMTVNYDGVPNMTTPATPVEYTVTFNNADDSGGSNTYTAKPYEQIGHAIEEKELEIADKAPHYYFNGSIVDVYTIIPITEDIEIDVKWEDVSKE